MGQQSTSGATLERLRTHLGITQKELGKILKVTSVTIGNWERSEPSFSGSQIETMLKLGVNPLYPYGYGRIHLPEFEFDTVCDNVKNALNAPEAEE